MSLKLEYIRINWYWKQQQQQQNEHSPTAKNTEYMASPYSSVAAKKHTQHPRLQIVQYPARSLGRLQWEVACIGVWHGMTANSYFTLGDFAGALQLICSQWPGPCDPVTLSNQVEHVDTVDFQFTTQKSLVTALNFKGQARQGRQC